MSYGSSAYGEIAFGEEAGGGTPTLTFSATIEQRITQLTYQFHAIIEQRIYTAAQFSATIEQQVVYPSVVFSATIEQRIWESRSFTATIEQQIYGTPTGIWSPLVLVDGVDISASVTGEIRIVSAEASSMIADINFRPASGTVDLLSFVGDSLTVDYQDDDWNVRRFTGIVAKPGYQPLDGRIVFQCSSDMQGSLEATPREYIDAIIPDGLWSKDVFDDGGDGWQYAQDLASTAPGSLWSDKLRAVRWTPWAAKVTPDIALTEADIIDGRVDIRYASKRDLIKRNLIELDYRFYNLRARQHSFSFQYDRPFCEFLLNPFPLPTRDMVRSAAESSGWQLDSINYTDLPKSQYFTCSPDPDFAYAGYKFAYVENELARASCLGANFKMSKRWAQRVRENYLIDVRCEDDLYIANRFAVRESWGIESEFDATAWENEPVKHVGLSKGAFNGVPLGGGLHPGGSGDYVEEADTDRRAEMELAQQVILAKASSEILETHRKTEVTFSILMRPGIDLSTTIRIDTPQVSAQGKVIRIEDVLSVESGQAVSTITLAISRKSGVGIETGSALDPVTRPDATQETPFKQKVHLGFRIGGTASPRSGSISLPSPGGGLGASADNDDDFNGYSTNYQRSDPEDPSLTFYSHRMTVIAPAIEQAAVDATILEAEQVYSVAVPEDLLTLTK